MDFNVKDYPLIGKERGVAVIGWGLLALAGVSALYFFGPVLIALAWTTVQIAIALGIVTVLGTAWISGGDRLLKLLGRLLVRRITRAVIERDPISVLKSLISYLEERLQVFDEKRNRVGGSIVRLRRDAEVAAEQFETARNRALAFQQDGDTGRAQNAARDAQRWEKTGQDVVEQLDRLQKIYDALAEMRQRAVLVIEDTNGQVDNLEMRLRSSKAAGEAMAAVEDVMDNPEFKSLMKETTDYVESQIADQLGTITMVMEDTDGLLAQSRGEKKAANLAANAALQRWSAASGEATPEQKNGLRDALKKARDRQL